MYVRKFEAETLDEALKQIKQELGPDAVILKTVTNKGLKGAFKKRKIEITAAISEKNLGNKMRVDKVLTQDQKKEFYQQRGESISNKIEKFNHSQESYNTVGARNTTYGHAGLNKAVQSIKESVKSGLDEFLGDGPVSSIPYHSFENSMDDEEITTTQTPTVRAAPVSRVSTVTSTKEEQKLIFDLESRLASLEEKLFSLHGQLDKTEKKTSNKVLKNAFEYFRSLDLAEKFINETYKKLVFELNDEEQNDQDAIFDFILREMDQKINLAMPLFSQSNNLAQGILTVFVSEVASGQSTCVLKLASLKKDCQVVVYDERSTTQSRPTEKLLGLNVYHATSYQDAVASIRKAIEDGVNVFLDLKLISQKEESKKLVEGLRRAFTQVEVMVSLSAIHGQAHNFRLLHKFSNLAQGMVINHLDLCMNFAHIFNLTHAHPKVPLIFFGTGQVIPDDVEAASKERILGNLFNL